MKTGHQSVSLIIYSIKSRACNHLPQHIQNRNTSHPFRSMTLNYNIFYRSHKGSYRSEIQQIVELLVCFHCSHPLLLFTRPFQSQSATTNR